MKFYGKPYNYEWAVNTVQRQLPTPGFIWPAQLGPPVDRPGGYYNMRPYEGVLSTGEGPMNAPRAYSGYRGYGAVAPIEQATTIWFTPEIFDDPENAAGAAAGAAEDFEAAGYTITSIGFNILSYDETTGQGTANGYILFAGEGPPGSKPLGEAVPEPVKEAKLRWYHYLGIGAAGAAGGFIGGWLVGRK